ncbi:MAG: thiol reductase thioredoxin [Paenibacillus macerans]|uniref:Bacteriocin transport accessory protein n=1 Tax=Paenibacillus macerans TaxID=44252 RepID=A0A090ZFP9_PAEMA|nr:thiol reductase thioredoxin [Paenibacillus macerans]KFN10124.1 hypothetical protein DJ90_519 [Paenibacillus macerans]MCY7560959.1 thiol reductase thioredoxin [Paenibacillus macerans]MDU7473382.1 thiol reductase thioredoxin [Paenibacillus macerans]MEC0138075.1 thiol reductase thioredoxin [Paenibacillus macerans]MEC0153623.1 thiol reductase thioredoxin [Paenibacillus macerans]
MRSRKIRFLWSITLTCIMCLFVAGSTYASSNMTQAHFGKYENGVTVEEYENNVKHLPKLNADETIAKFNSGEGFYIYIGRPSCYYCREFSPVLKDFSLLISQPIYYYNLDGGDWGPEIGQFLVDHIDFQGTPTLAYIKEGKAVVKQVGSGPNVDELLTLFANCPQ